MTAHVDQVVVFDTSTDSRELRYERTLRALAQGACPGEPKVMLTGDRQECLQLLMLNEDHHTLLLCDMLDERKDVGNIGARLLRTVAHDRDLASQVWRVLWSRHDHPVVITDIEPYAHAFVWFDPTDRDSALLSSAIRHVVSEPPGAGREGAAPAYRWFAPRGLTAEQHTAQWRTALQRLLKEGRELKRNDEVAVASILRGVPDKVTNERLKAAREAVPAAERRGYCASINEFLDRIRGDKRQARDAVFEALVSMSQVGIVTTLTPELLERAEELMRQSLRHDQLRYQTLLTEGEDALARTLVERYRHHLHRLGPKLHNNNETTKHQALDEALWDGEVQALFSHTDLADCSQTHARRAETLSHVICVYNDTARSLDARALQRAG